MRTLVLALMAAAMLGACAVTPPPITPIDWQAARAQIPQGGAMLYVVRPQKPAGRDNLYRISINGAPLADMQTGTWFATLVQPGEVRVAAQVAPSVTNVRTGLPFLERPELTATVPAGQITFVRVGVNIEGGPTLATVDAATGQALAERARQLRLAAHQSSISLGAPFPWAPHFLGLPISQGRPFP